MLPRLILAAVALSLAGAAPAAADSIAYIQGNDIWLATPDGARKQQVTHTGTYYYVSQADDGTLAALVPRREDPEALAHRPGPGGVPDLRLRRLARRRRP